MYFILSLHVWCERCKRPGIEKITSVSVQTSDDRKFMLAELKRAGWQIDYDLRRGLNGPVLCPECAKERSEQP